MLHRVAVERMPTSTRNNHPQGVATNGFTLVELMVVLVVMGLAASIVIMTLPSREEAGVRAATKFAARAAAARDFAIMSGKPTGVWMTASGYGFESMSEGRWSALTTRTLKDTDWGKGVAAQFSTGAAARVRFDSVGLASNDVVVSIVGEGEGPRKVSIGMNGDVGLAQ